MKPPLRQKADTEIPKEDDPDDFEEVQSEIKDELRALEKSISSLIRARVELTSRLKDVMMADDSSQLSEDSVQAEHATSPIGIQIREYRHEIDNQAAHIRYIIRHLAT